MDETFQIQIKGQVQGVGFRPFVYNLANDFKLFGNVYNNTEGVVINLTGHKEVIYQFYNQLIAHPPPVSKINYHTLLKTDYKKYDDFSIQPSSKESKINLKLTPDFALCNACKDEIELVINRRYSYPFTTCVNCGPRWAITKLFPFERTNTSIAGVHMCNSCLDEYTNPSNRRFHSQTNSCPDCGFHLSFTNSKNELISNNNKFIFKSIAQKLEAGAIVAIKNTAGYLLCCDARNASAITELRKRKKRPQKPFAVLYPSIENLKSELKISEKEEHFLNSTERPILIVSTKNYQGSIALNEVAPKLNQLGVMVPYSALLHLLFTHISFPIVATSGNIHGSPIISSEFDAVPKLSTVADYFLHHNMNILHPQDDSVIKISSVNENEILFRRSRGYAPNYFSSNAISKKNVLATGAHLKSTIAFVPNDYIYLSQYLGNLDNFEVTERYLKTTNDFISIFEEQPEIILADSHPQYESNKTAHEMSQNFKVPIFEIQHHKAHMMSVIGEHSLADSKDKILGVTWDGTGYGEDYQIWGSEFFIYQNHQIKRISHLNYFNWIAGNKMALEPRLSLFSLMTESMESLVKEKFTSEEWGIYSTLKSSNSLKTSSMGRLFDAVASLLNLVDYNTYEGEAAIVLENQIINYDLEKCKNYHPNIINNLVDGQQILENCFHDFINNVPISDIVANFLYTLSLLVFEVANQHQIKNIALSGGVFQNTTLVDMLCTIATNQYNLYFNHQLSPNDENIAIGQLMYYYHCIKH